MSMSSSAPPERRPFLGIFPEQLGYVQCSFCTTILLVSVPSYGLQLTTAAVQCGNCAGVLSVTLPPRTPTTPVVELPIQEPGVDPPPRESEDECSREDREVVEADEAENVVFPVVNKPPVRKQRTPSAYNCFIKEEIRRIKARDPSISHKQAFSSASKNVKWAHLPRIQQKGN